ncbi:GDP-L-galactose phosphorylase 1-like [Malania oleifera]|uniref:GDP-L-galactose phosphorylase 1-like n=1 Tax=Malania oleifera TaxID=397392 RepID=UPI0025AE9D22|nr:GDP-L-galactose phosphorylase 1-like [Malania oleifera]XP_057971917.1 GDP-L-galactose phosphorylase 1-like [Malania oleifera]XP_057971919.1 GDP-L-galactose phosphorylase 1-like [Malania oleifera]XP_057971920.1 GDP-L-galactose phosphorylase 1-like [Malania oleifera]XP_057971921.1 GDP-L-galactose phosphorylase 1-like [Malania oleifera]XP_057971922.1 GDP-L-galactose phosphorylase 1-like [Malania oleifera]XP_057971923.1 GDP-L-galactose phosphorylase 1-like [Malania oleifera]XP_057971924.1 GDP
MVTVKQFEDDNYPLQYTSFKQYSRISSEGIRVPLYCLGTQPLIDNGPLREFSCDPDEDESILNSLLLAQWEDRLWKGLCKYDVTTSEIKVISGKRKFLAQLNEGWDVDQLSNLEESKACCQGDASMFKCKKHFEELLFCVAMGKRAKPEFIPMVAVPNNVILIIMNVTPVEYGHIFLLPCGWSRLSQSMDAKFLEMIIRVSLEINNSSFRMFYDWSISSAPHPYFQACYFPNHLPVELMPVLKLFNDWGGRICIMRLLNYPIKALLFESSDNLQVLVEALVAICSFFKEKNFSYSLLLSDCGKKIFLFPQVPTSADSCALPAWECGGHFLFKSRSDFDEATEEAILERLAAASLDDERFQEVEQFCCRVAGKLAH